ncbi:MAG TPA: putative manganese transporter, partial [Afifellaceae bacterium]|nr:putative manganese transporter [Afifellaceae bacterium]
MTELALRSGRTIIAFWSARLAPNGRKLAVLVLIALLISSSAELAEVVMQALADAYLQVTVFVAATLALFYSAEKAFNVDLGAVMARHVGWQPAIAAILGALPGCGGAIVVVTQFTRGYASFGALISVLVATMGDAAFLLIAREPAAALVVMAISLSAGTLTGWIVDRLHGADYLRAASGDTDAPALADTAPEPWLPEWSRGLWFALLAPGLVLGIMTAMQIDTDAVIGIAGATRGFGFLSATFCILLWALSGHGNSHVICPIPTDKTGDRVVIDTNFVTAWVVAAFLTYEVAVFGFGADVSTLFNGWAPVMPMVGLLV